MSVGDGPRTGDETRRFRAFYDWPAPVEFDAVLPDDLDGGDDERQFLLDEAPFAKLAAVRVEAAVPADTVDAGATNPPNLGETATPSGNDGSADLRAEQVRIDKRRAWERALAEVLDPAAFDDSASIPPVRRDERQVDALIFAMRAGLANYRLVVEDDTTVERVAEQTRKHALDLDRLNRADDADYCTCGEVIEDWDEHWVRAAVRALREDTP